MSAFFLVISCIVISSVLLFVNASKFVWAIVIFSALIALSKIFGITLLLGILWLVSFLFFCVFLIKPIRQFLFTRSIFKLFRKIRPTMSITEKEALEAGSVTWEGDLFNGDPDFSKLLNIQLSSLSEAEKDFINEEVEQLSSMLDEWDITHNKLDLPPKAWQFIKDKGFLGMIIPKEYGGLAFSASAQSQVLIKLYAKSISAATTVAVPNSLGPAELLLKYGTEEQKSYYLPRLASGKEIPCFGLTSPYAGSDAASIPDKGVVTKGQYNGKEVLGIRLSWDKRYITLAPVATVIGLAFRLFDPDGLLGDKEDIGITCALLPADQEGVEIGRRHFPLNTAFMNGPIKGKNVFIPLDSVIGGVEKVGQGWRMLMECLSAGRAISLPSSGVGCCKANAIVSGAYARIRKQFNTAIANFEGIEQPLAHLASDAYVSEAALSLAVSSIDDGEEPAVVSAILKYHTTEAARRSTINAMDIHGGKGICLGPKNYLGRAYQNAPISITVEGANILTRCLIIFGQGAIRCHPYILDELKAAEKKDLNQFDGVFWSHISHILSHTVKSFLYGLTDALFIRYHKDELKRTIQLLKRYASNLAFLADFSMISLGAELKKRERISARLADVLSMLYLTSATIKRFHDDGRPNGDLVLVKWSVSNLLFQLEQAMFEAIDNFPARWARLILKVVLFPIGRKRKPPRDRMGQAVAKLITHQTCTRERLAKGISLNKNGNPLFAELEDAFVKLAKSEEIEKKVSMALKDCKISSLTLLEQIQECLELSLINKEEASQLTAAEEARQKVIAVDDFSVEELLAK